MDSKEWDDRYRTAEFVWSTEANRFLAPEVSELDAGRALDVACGEGRNAVWLATQGWESTGVDFSRAGLAKAEQLAERNDVAVRWIQADVTTWTPADEYDLVIVFYLQVPEAQRRDAFSIAARAMAPGATLLIVGHDLANLRDGFGGPQDPGVLYTPDDVVGDLAQSGVADLVVQRAERVERVVQNDTGTHTAVDCLVRARRRSD